MQETFLAAYRGLDDFDRKKEQAWICRIALNKCLDFLKSAGRRQVPMAEILPDCEMDTGAAPEHIYLQKESDAAVRKLCKSLKEPYGSVAYAHFYEGKTAAEISGSTGVGIKTVQTHIYRARNMLKDKLKKYAIEYAERSCDAGYRKK